MESKNYKEYQELLEKWKNFSKVYDAIHRAYKLGYDEGIETEKYCQRMAEAEAIDLRKLPSVPSIKLDSLKEATLTVTKLLLDISEMRANEIGKQIHGYDEAMIEKFDKELENVRTLRGMVYDLQGFV